MYTVFYVVGTYCVCTLRVVLEQTICIESSTSASDMCLLDVQHQNRKSYMNDHITSAARCSLQNGADFWDSVPAGGEYMINKQSIKNE